MMDLSALWKFTERELLPRILLIEMVILRRLGLFLSSRKKDLRFLVILNEIIKKRSVCQAKRTKEEDNERYCFPRTSAAARLATAYDRK